MLASIVLIIMIVMHINAFYFEESYGGYSEYNTPAYTPNEYCKEVPNSSDAWYAGLECDEMKVKIYDLSWKFLLTFGLAIFCFKKNKS